ncbi:MAG: hypothetical protein ACC726_07225 [Chloroflexota bacterium]
MMRGRRWPTLIFVVLLVVVGCTSPDRPSVQADTIALPTPLRSFDASLSATIRELQGAVAAVGSRLDSAQRAYRPSEPQLLLQVPRAVMRADMADPDDGFVVVYDFADVDAARSGGLELAGYLSSGFGQTNFLVDTQFSVSLLGDTVVFTSWSRRRSSDPEKAEAVFDAVAGVGEEIEVRK